MIRSDSKHMLVEAPYQRQIDDMICTMLHTSFGNLVLVEEAGVLTQIRWGQVVETGETDLLSEAVRQINEYDAGRRKVFDLPLRVNGSGFQRDVCAAISTIAFGDTRTYGEIAKDLGVPAQAVGQACGNNPIPIVIPCHRVMGAKGLTGFSGGAGVETKVALLRHEGAAGLLI